MFYHKSTKRIRISISFFFSGKKKKKKKREYDCFGFSKNYKPTFRVSSCVPSFFLPFYLTSWGDHDVFTFQ